ncbi:MAG: Ig-like domain-containing protein [Candidatus Shapirobacteria bacterium]|jgi:hypothetical protein
MKKSTKLLFVIICIILFLSGSLFLRLKIKKPVNTSVVPMDIEFAASKKSSSGVDPQSPIIISSSQTLDAQAISQAIKITPEADYSVKKINDNSAELNFRKPLEKSTVYQISLNRSRWAFQIESPLAVTGSLPGNKSTDVNPNTSIEFYLNNPDFLTSANQYFNIQPSVSGRFEKHQNSLVFIPSSLTADTLYTVTLKKGFPLADNSQKLPDDFSFQFETGNTDKTQVSRFDFQKPIFESSPDKPPIAIISNWDPPSQKVKAKLYQFNSTDFQDCLTQKIALPSWARHSRYYRCQTTGKSISEFELDTKSPTEYGSKYLELPSKLPIGYYALEVINPDTSISQTLIEVSPLSWFYWIGVDDSLFWVNDLVSQKPLADVKLFLGSKELGASNTEGLVKLTTHSDLKSRQNQILTIKTALFTAYNLIEYQNTYGGYFASSEAEIEKNKYWSYLYTDRAIYLPSDKISFWGIVKSRAIQSQEPITVELSRNSYSYWREENSSDNIIKKIEITPSNHGTFQGVFDFSNLNPGYYSLIAKKGDTFITQQGFSVETFKKPIFRITAKPQKLVIWAGQPNKVDLSVKFYDGTPVSETPIVWNMYDSTGNKKGEIITDKAGNASLEIPTVYDSTKNYWPQNVSVNFRPKGMQEADIDTYTSFFVFGPEYNLTVDSETIDSQSRITVTVRKNDLSLLEKSPWKNEGNPVANQSVSVKTERVWYDKVETGDYYDPINKITSKRYRYDKKTEGVSSQNLITDSNGKVTYSQPVISGQQYEIFVTAIDSQNRPTKSTIYISGSNSSSFADFYAKTSKDKYSLGDQIEVSLNYGNDPAPTSEPNKYLIFFVRNGKIYNTTVSENNKLSFQFGNDYVPNIILKSVWFSGSTYKISNNARSFLTNGLNLTFDTSSKELNIDAKTDKSKYQPGEEALVELSVKNNANQPQPNTKVLLSVVDESLSDIGGISSSGILSELYSSLGEGRLVDYYSNQVPENGGGAEGGGGGGESRSVFKNTVAFTELTTDATGVAKYKLKFPDNITSWRATMLAVGNDLSAGDGQLLIPVTKPLFVDIVTNDEFIITDKPKITAISYGEGLDTDSQISYSLNSPSLGINLKNISQKAFLPLEFDLGQLVPGKHRLEVKTSSGSFNDILIKTIDVVKSRNLLPKQEIISLDKQYKPIFTSQRPVYFTFIDKGLNSLYSKLKQFTGLNSYGLNERVDRLVAENISVGLLSQYFSEDTVETEESFSRYIHEKGVSLMPNSDADLVLTAKFAAANLPLVSKSQLSSALSTYFRQETSIERASAALWGLSETGKSLLTSIDILSKEKNTPRGQIYLGLALASQGDQISAGKILNEIIAKYGVKQDPYLFIKVDNNEQNTLENTALAMILSAKVGSIELLDKLWSYLDIAKSEEQLYVLEKAITIKSSIASYPSSLSEFEYQLLGQKFTKKLSDDKIHTVVVPQNELSTFSATPISGSVDIIVRWWEDFDLSQVTVNQNISLDVSTAPISKISGSEYMEFIVTPKISKNTTNESYLVSVNLPSGLRLIDNPYFYKTLSGKNEFFSFPSYIENNRLIFRSNFTYPIRFLARPINKGQFSFEPSFLYSSSTINQLNVSKPHPDITIN